MLGSSIKLSFLSRRTSKVQLREILSRQNRAKTAVLTHADHIQHVIACDQPIGMKRKGHYRYLLLTRFSLVPSLCVSQVWI